MMSITNILMIAMIIIAYGFILGICYYFTLQNKSLFSYNQSHKLRLWIVYLLGFLFCGLLYVIPFYAFPIGILAVFLVAFSSQLLGFVMYISYLLLAYYVWQVSVGQLFVMFLVGVAGCVLFGRLTKAFRYTAPVVILLVIDCGLYFIPFVTDAAVLPGDFLLYSGIRLFAEFILLIIFLKILFDRIISRNDLFYSNISDPDHELLLSLKDIDEDAYYHAVHTAYLADKAARCIHADHSLARALGYYHRIGLIQGKDTIQNTLTVAATCHFPAPLRRVMKEYGIKHTATVSREAAIVQICDALVSSLTYLFQKDADSQVNYEKIIDVIIHKKTECDDLANCDLTLKDISLIKKELLEEKKYYDFLR